MKTIYILKRLLFTLFIMVAIVNCDTYNEELIVELDVDREFAPVALTAKIRNQTVAELSWKTDENVDHYVVEFSADDPDFNVIFKSVDVTSDQLPVQIALEGETVYSIRVKAISGRNLDESKWSLSEATTLTEQIMLASEAGDIEATQATLRWVAGSNVTHIEVSPGNITHTITNQEKIDGVALVTGLTSETDYAALLWNNDKTRGSSTFTTGIDVGDNTLVSPEDDLFQIIADAEDGDILLLEEGDYTTQVGTITLDKSITIRGYKADFKPLLKIGFSIAPGANDVSLIDLDLTGDVAAELIDVVSYSAVGDYNSMLISGCNIHDYNRSFVRGSTTGSILQTLTIENSIVTNVLTSGGDFIDFRNSDVLNVNVTTSTFNNCAPERDFFRLDDAGTSTGSGFVCNVLLESCTINASSNKDSRRMLYIRFQTNDITVKNNLFTNTVCEGYSDQSRTDESVTFDNNNYFNAAGFTTPNTVYDNTATFTELDPGYADASSGDFTISNQDLIDNAVGDPRWR